MKPRNFIVLICFFMCLSEANSALPHLSSRDRKKLARMIVTGHVDDLSVRVRNHGRDSDWLVEIKAKVENIEKGSPEDVAPELNIFCWQIRSRANGWAGPTGHADIPAKSARFRMWLMKDESGKWTPLQPNGIALLDGHSRLNFKNPEMVSVPHPQPIPEADEAYLTKEGLQFERLSRDWYVDGRAKVENTFEEVGRNLTTIEIQNVSTGELYLIPRGANSLMRRDANGEMELVDQITRTIPPVTKGEPRLEVFRSVLPDQKRKTDPIDAAVPQDPISSDNAIAFVRMGGLWERIDMASERVESRYLQEYRDEHVIQLKAILEEEWQQPHTLSIVLDKDGGSVVLSKSNSEFARVQLKRVEMFGK